MANISSVNGTRAMVGVCLPPGGAPPSSTTRTSPASPSKYELTRQAHSDHRSSAGLDHRPHDRHNLATPCENPTNFGSNATRTFLWQADDGAIGNPSGT